MARRFFNFGCEASVKTKRLKRLILPFSEQESGKKRRSSFERTAYPISIRVRRKWSAEKLVKNRGASYTVFVRNRKISSATGRKRGEKSLTRPKNQPFRPGIITRPGKITRPRKNPPDRGKSPNRGKIARPKKNPPDRKIKTKE